MLSSAARWRGRVVQLRVSEHRTVHVRETEWSCMYRQGAAHCAIRARRGSRFWSGGGATFAFSQEEDLAYAHAIGALERATRASPARVRSGCPDV